MKTHRLPPGTKLVEKSQPDHSTLHVNRPLTDMSVAFVLESGDFAAHRVFQNIPSAKKSDTYFVIPRGAFMRNEVQERAPGTASESVGYGVTTDSFDCKVYGLNHPIPDENRANADAPLNMDTLGARLLAQMSWIKQEKLWNDSFFTTSVWSKDITGNTSPSVPGTSLRQWDSPDSTPIEDIAYYRKYMKEQTGYRFNILTMGAGVWEALMNHPDILTRILYNTRSGDQPAMVTKQALAALFQVEEIVVSEATMNTAKEGQATDVFSYILGKHCLLSYRPPAPGREVPAAGYTFSWTGMGLNDQGFRIRRYREEMRHSDIIDMDAAFVHKKVSADLGIFLNGVIA